MRLLIASLLVSAALLTGISPAGEKGTKPEQPPAAGPKKDAGEVQPITIKASITKADPFDTKRQQCHHKLHVVKLLPGYQYVIDMKADKHKDKDMPSFDTYLRLEDAAGNEIAANDDYITTDSRIVYTPTKAEDYRIICTTFDEGFTGAYTLTVTPYKGGVKGADPMTLLNINGVINNADPLDVKRATSHHKVHLFKMVPGKTYQIDMISAQFDAYLRLENSSGTQLDEDDDSGGNLNARMVFTPSKADNYRIIATTFGANMTGMYQLKITAK